MKITSLAGDGWTVINKKVVQKDTKLKKGPFKFRYLVYI